MRNKKIILSVFFLIFISFFLIKSSFSDEDTCNYTAKIEECLQAVEEGTTRAIEEFVCINSNEEEITFQIVLDEKFKEVDEEAEKYLQDLEDNKDRFFGPGAQENYFHASNEVENTFAHYGEYWEKYDNLCGIDIIKEVQSCQNGRVNNENASIYFRKSRCMTLANVKLEMYRQVAYDILLLNKLQVREDSAKLYVQEERTKYDELLFDMMINVGYLERIWQKWPKKEKNTY